ncbi:MAG: TetR-like C-terminal domain-containing protein [Oscillospiraceae bacterium]
MNKPIDRRIRRTQHQLRCALEKVMQTKSISNITVKELCLECDINRGTFYLHYKDVYDLLYTIEGDMLAEFEKVINCFKPGERFGGAAPSKSMCAMFEFFKENAAMCRVLLCKNGDMSFTQRVTGVVYNQMTGPWKEYFGSEETDMSTYAFAFIVSGCIGMLQQWLESGAVTPPNTMALLMENILVKGIAALGEKD